MITGIFRGSFDPPHLGHLETVNCAFQNGINKIVVVFTDTNPLKPNRSNNEIRLKLIRKLFESCVNIEISINSFKFTLQKCLEDPTVNKVRLIIGTDLLNVPFRPIKHEKEVDCLAIPRNGLVLEKPLGLWNGLPVQFVNVEGLVDRNTSSTEIKSYLANNKILEAKKVLSSSLLELILNEKLYKSPLREVAENLLPNCQFEMAKLGKSDDTVFFIRDQEGVCRYVAKIFSDSKNFNKEILGYEKIQKLNLSYIKVPKLCYAADQMLIAEFALGKPLAELMAHSPEALILLRKSQ